MMQTLNQDPGLCARAAFPLQVSVAQAGPAVRDNGRMFLDHVEHAKRQDDDMVSEGEGAESEAGTGSGFVVGDGYLSASEGFSEVDDSRDIDMDAVHQGAPPFRNDFRRPCNGR